MLYLNALHQDMSSPYAQSSSMIMMPEKLPTYSTMSTILSTDGNNNPTTSAGKLSLTGHTTSKTSDNLPTQGGIISFVLSSMIVYYLERRI